MSETPEAALALLVSKKDDVRARLTPEAQEHAAIEQATAALRQKFEQEYHTSPPKDMASALAQQTAADYDAALAADLDALRVTALGFVDALAQDMARWEDLPDLVTARSRGRPAGSLSRAEEVQIELLQELKVQGVRAELSGASFETWLGAYEDAVRREDAVTLRYIEAAQAAGWPRVARQPEHVQAQQRLEGLVRQTRAARVPADVRAVHARARGLWDTSLDVIYRTTKGRHLGRVK